MIAANNLLRLQTSLSTSTCHQPHSYKPIILSFIILCQLYWLNFLFCNSQLVGVLEKGVFHALWEFLDRAGSVMQISLVRTKRVPRLQQWLQWKPPQTLTSSSAGSHQWKNTARTLAALQLHFERLIKDSNLIWNISEVKIMRKRRHSCCSGNLVVES